MGYTAQPRSDRNSRPARQIDITELDVIKNPGGIKIVPLEAAQAPRALDDVDFAAVQGNFAIYSGLKLTNAFALEKIKHLYQRGGGKAWPMPKAQWAQDIVASYKSQTFKTAILDRRYIARLYAAGLSQVNFYRNTARGCGGSVRTRRTLRAGRTE